MPQQISRDIVPFPREEPLNSPQSASIEEIGDHHRIVENVAEHFRGLHGTNAAPRLLDLHQRVESVRQREKLLVGEMAVQNAGERAQRRENHVLVRRHEAVDDLDDAAAGSQRVLR